MATTNVTAPGAEGIGVSSAGELSYRELEVVREIADAFLSSPHPLEVYRLALAKLTPMFGARFSSIFLRDATDPTLLKLECAYNWPQASARFLGQLRIRVGRGPTGRAVALCEPVEVTDLLLDPMLREWWEPARELGFRSMISLPLRADRGAAASTAPASGQPAAVGAVSFYFEDARDFTAEERRLLVHVADHLAATAAKSQLMEELREANEALRARNEQLAHRLAEFESARRLKDEFLANISHEFRTPLTSILGYGYLLASSQYGELGERQADAVQKIEGAGKALLRLVNDLIDLCQVKLGQMKARPGREDAVALARRAAEQAGDPPQGVTFTVSTGEAGMIITTDGDKVVRVLTNLLANAFKFTPEGSVVLDVARRSGANDDWIEWSVRDTGVGIRAEDHALIFDEFRQVDGSSTRLFGGTGLGLALSRRLAQLLGGEILVESEPGRGSRFTFRLPVSGPSAERPAD